MAIAVRRPVRRARRVPAKKTTKPKMTLDQRIAKICLKEQETKIKTFTIFDSASIKSSGLNNAGTKGFLVKNILGAPIFSMAQGNNQQQRQGNSINNCKLTLRGFLHSNQAQTTTNPSPFPFEVHVLVYKTKIGSGGDPDDLLQAVDDTNIPISGSDSSTLLPWNKDTYTIKKHRVFRMKANPVSAVSTTPNVVGIENPSFNGSEAAFFRRFAFDVNIRDLLKFDDTGTAPVNEWCSVAAYVINGDGTILGSDHIRSNITIMGTLKYKDS